MDDSALDSRDVSPSKRERSSLSATQFRGDVSPRSHSKSTSNSVFARLPFLRSHTSDSAVVTDEPLESGESKEPELPAQRSSAMASVMEQQGRKRRSSSLRKAAMMGTSLLRRDKSNSAGENNKKDLKLDQIPPSTAFTPSIASRLSPRRFTFELPSETSSTEAFPELHQELSIDTSSITSNGTAPEVDNLTASPTSFAESTVTSPTDTYTSATDDDDRTSLKSNTESSTASKDATESPIVPTSTNEPRRPSPTPSSTSSVSSSYLAVPFSSPPSRHRSTKSTTKSPLAATLPSHYDSITSLVASSSTGSVSVTSSSEDWDYAETEWWGWVVLVVTWIVFVVGMGSCLNVWSWAWDVDSKPSAPPEFEDDPTLPIVGYYPALIVMTAVMSWLWVVVAWVGMKYFKHAKIQGD